MKPNRGYEPRRQVDIGKMTGRTWSMDKGKQGEKGRYDEKNYREDKDKREKNERQVNKWNKITFDERGRRKRRY